MIECDFNRINAQGQLILSGMRIHENTNFEPLVGIFDWFVDGNEEVKGVVLFDKEYNVYVAVVDWETQRPLFITPQKPIEADIEHIKKSPWLIGFQLGYDKGFKAGQQYSETVEKYYRDLE